MSKPACLRVEWNFPTNREAGKPAAFFELTSKLPGSTFMCGAKFCYTTPEGSEELSVRARVTELLGFDPSVSVL